MILSNKKTDPNVKFKIENKKFTALTLARYAILRIDIIKHIEFEEESKLREISQELFFDSLLVSISIQKGVRRICDSAFFFCGHLKSVVIDEDSELCEIDKSSLYGSKIESILVRSCPK